jgi:hypothetical protein
VATIAVVVGFGVLGAGVTSWLVRRSAKLTVLVRDESGDRRSAGVFVDGSRRCDFSPCVIEVPAGDHIVTVTTEGAPPTIQNATFRAGDDATMTFVLPAIAPTEVASAAQPGRPPASGEAVPPASPASAGASAAPPGTPANPVTQARVAPAQDAPRKSAAVGSPCKLQLNAIPVAEVNLDGASIGETPRMNVSAQPGDHRVVFAAGEARKTVVFHCGDGEEKTIAVRVP